MNYFSDINYAFKAIKIYFLLTCAFRMQQKLDYGMHTIPRYYNGVANRQKNKSKVSGKREGFFVLIKRTA